MMTHSSEIAIEASYLYCFAISLLIRGESSSDAFNKTRAEVESPTIKEWFNEIESPKKTDLTPA
jgi:ADP-ribosylglycohydrolase